MTLKLMSTGRSRQGIRFRESDRRAVNFRGFALGEGVDADVVLSNLSYCGCGLVSAQPLERGKQIELRIVRKGTVSAEVRWSEGHEAGVRFRG
jgi:hypothetical protein